VDSPRPWVRAGRLTSGRAVPWLALGAVLVLLLTIADQGFDVFAVAAMVAVLPLPIYLALALWIDRYEPEPRAMLATAFLWGASVAVLAAGLLNAMADAVVGETLGSIVAGPIVEECLKAAILFRFFVKRPDEFDGIIDGLVYAAMVGLGFAFVENIDYYGRSLVTEGAGGLAVTFTLRGIISPFSHPLFTALTGLGLGIARQTSRTWVRKTAPPAGLVGAAALHGLWNAGTMMGCVFFAIYGLIMLPMLAVILLVAVRALRREGRMIRAQLAGEVAQGFVSAEELERLCGVRGRLDSSLRAWMTGGRAAWNRRRTYHRTVSELAFLRDRVARGTHPPDPELEAAYLEALVGPPSGTPPAGAADSPPVSAVRSPGPPASARSATAWPRRSPEDEGGSGPGSVPRV
jgi:RsiW-degrading membrane proteinase PrsW (M82 family)